MKKNEVKIGETYLAKVTGKIVPVEIFRENPRGGWDAINTKTRRTVRIKSAQRLRGKAATLPGKRIVTKAEYEAANDGFEVVMPVRSTNESLVGADAAKATKDAKPAGKRDPSTPGGYDVAGTGERGDVNPLTRAYAGEKLSGLDAAAKVLTLGAALPMRCGDIVKIMIDRGYWKTNGKTPAATIYAAITREIAAKGDASRFVKAERGKFTLTK